ncbi:unnamed protein product [marine sediment metagenome]|uniref:Uncharacterized protein n=1 Tax=marine sediment metagenome TaxID=412755 RepID=X1CAD2_9ZZZZ
MESLEMTATLATPHLSGPLQTLMMHSFVPQVVQAAREIQLVAARREELVVR